jgi:hypothetical protein
MKTGNSYFQKIRSNAVTFEGFNVDNGSVSNLSVNKLTAGIILPSVLGSIKTVVGYTSTSFSDGANVSSSLNTVKGSGPATALDSPTLLILPANSRVIAAVATTDGEPINAAVNIDIGTLALSITPTTSGNIFNTTGNTSFNEPGVQVGALTLPSGMGSTGSLVDGGSNVIAANATSMVTVTASAPGATTGNLKVTIYYV